MPAKRALVPQSTTEQPPQRFTVDHDREDAFKPGGLRSYAVYRDLGIEAATGGLARVHVMRFLPECRGREVFKRHYHEVTFQMLYCLKGWIRYEFEGQGEVEMRAGSCWLEPPGIWHKLLDYSDDCELLEVVLPADFRTVAVE